MVKTAKGRHCELFTTTSSLHDTDSGSHSNMRWPLQTSRNKDEPWKSAFGFEQPTKVGTQNILSGSNIKFQYGDEKREYNSNRFRQGVIRALFQQLFSKFWMRSNLKSALMIADEITISQNRIDWFNENNTLITELVILKTRHVSIWCMIPQATRRIMHSSIHVLCWNRAYILLKTYGKMGSDKLNKFKLLWNVIKLKSSIIRFRTTLSINCHCYRNIMPSIKWS